MLEATSPQYQGLRGRGEDAHDVVRNLLEKIVDEVPLGPEMVNALRAAGHTTEVITALDRCLVGDLRDRYLRNPPDLLADLDEYAAHGVPAETACRYMLTILTAEEAGRVHAAGHAPEDVLPYISWSATDRWYHWDFDYVEWMLAGVPAERCMSYAGRCSSADAAAWEPLVREHNISDQELQTIMRAGFTSQDSRCSLENGGGDVPGLVDAARLTLALTTPSQTRSVGGYDEPPF
ncbi:hypothetical protein ABEG17_02720 [Pedococcus sp. KACC 23699]|uniref:Uncharacterized protein n=1 Tax=Pedococcus sp. KACC 23699 TaxID=3149228 RepID=A0AAU7JV10_9MICO